MITYKNNILLHATLLITSLTPFSGRQQSNGSSLTTYSASDIAQEAKVATQGKNITSKNDYFVDATDRTLFVCGINLEGDTKIPYTPYGAPHIEERFYNGNEVSYVRHPFSLAEEADTHFECLKTRYFHFIHFLVTWEANEHEEPGMYDTSYLEYVQAIIKKAGTYSINLLIDPHQDVWNRYRSRYSGGDGAPMWVSATVDDLWISGLIGTMTSCSSKSSTSPILVF